MAEDAEVAEVTEPTGEPTGELTGVYRYDVVADSWWWSDEVFTLHGLTPGQVTPTTKLLREHQHPDDREHARALLEGCLADGEPYSCYHRIVAADGRVRRVVVVGDGQSDADGRLIGLRGFFVDVTDAVNRQVREIADEAIAAARDSQEDIDLARGIVMGVYGVDAEAALAILRRHSQHTNTRLRDIAASLVAAAPAPPGSLRTELRRRLERAFYA
ncbi:ANTAR domain-containing protein [Streptomyces sp. RKND-216]|uniref:PAS and ANTAR domain-containing protein n=1 Tax=Streptomyces sp. RKND-216 TaxID=2562581 RepID=UPI00109DE034|nr:PAS and ANTAR domain-containing protein [Streptomyces sp. RKND-216]THA24387.1 ANTAR domain-containing protein [Streptomyces sp. RKND-216]